jgi:hypothetical protein
METYLIELHFLRRKTTQFYTNNQISQRRKQTIHLLERFRHVKESIRFGITSDSSTISSGISQTYFPAMGMSLDIIETQNCGERKQGKLQSDVQFILKE